MKEDRIYVALGSNQGDRIATLREAVTAMHAWRDTRVVATSRLWRTVAVDADGGEFINAVVELRSDREPEPLLDALLALESALGRRRPALQGAARASNQRYAARPIDLDLLLHGERRCHGERLTLPHPRMHLRAFVLAPLADIAPDLRLTDGRTVRDALVALTRDMPLAPRVVDVDGFEQPQAGADPNPDVATKLQTRPHSSGREAS